MKLWIWTESELKFHRQMEISINKFTYSIKSKPTWVFSAVIVRLWAGFEHHWVGWKLVVSTAELRTVRMVASCENTTQYHSTTRFEYWIQCTVCTKFVYVCLRHGLRSAAGQIVSFLLADFDFWFLEGGPVDFDFDSIHDYFDFEIDFPPGEDAWLKFLQRAASATSNLPGFSHF